MRTSTTALAAAAIAVTVAACGGGDNTFDESGMTFSYPGDFKAGRAVGAHPSGRVIGIVGLGREDYIAARGQPSAPLPVDQLLISLPKVVAGVIPATVHLERHGNLPMVAATQKPPGAADLESQIYFFNGAGKTWQMECRSTAKQRSRIRAACRKALASVKVH
ncbi:MAG TPA: hypothetical protein VGN78_16000 [Solirubrobacteraceae bacterium]|nr:hypothetical protein [Solirubrobacteraceae bacterium]